MRLFLDFGKNMEQEFLLHPLIPAAVLLEPKSVHSWLKHAREVEMGRRMGAGDRRGSVEKWRLAGTGSGLHLAPDARHVHTYTRTHAHACMSAKDLVLPRISFTYSPAFITIVVGPGLGDLGNLSEAEALPEDSLQR